MTPQALLIVVIVWLATVIGAFFYGSGTGEDRAVAKQAAIESAIAETRRAAMEGAADAIAKIKVRNTTVQGKVETIIRDNPVYRGCGHDADTLRLLNEALTGRPGPTGDRGVPRVNPVN